MPTRDDTVIDFRVAAVEAAVERFSRGMEGVNENLNALTRLEERHARIADSLDRLFATVNKQNDRLVAIELVMPVLTETSSHVRKGMLAVVALVLMALIGMVVVQPAARQVHVDVVKHAPATVQE